MRNLEYILIGLLAFAIFSFVAFFFAINLLSRKENKKNIDFRNQFPFEVVPPLKSERTYLNVLYFLGVGSVVVSFILFATRFTNTMPIFMVVIATILMFSVGAIPYIYIRYFKEHMYLDIALVTLFFFISGLLSYFSYSVMKITDYKNINAIISLVVSLLLLVLSLFFIINPKLFNLKNDVNEEESVRAKVIPLAVAEWSIIFASILTIVPLILLSNVLSA